MSKEFGNIAIEGAKQAAAALEAGDYKTATEITRLTVIAAHHWRLNPKLSAREATLETSGINTLESIQHWDEEELE